MLTPCQPPLVGAPSKPHNTTYKRIILLCKNCFRKNIQLSKQRSFVSFSIYFIEKWWMENVMSFQVSGEKNTTFNLYLTIFCLFVLGLTSLWNIWGHITTVPACSSGTLTNVLPHRNAMLQTQDRAPHPVTVYRHGADLSLCYPLMWNITLEYTATHFNVLGETRPGNPSPTFHTHQRTLNLMLSWWSTVGSSVESTVPTGWCANPLRYPLTHSDFLTIFVSCLFLIHGSWHL